MILGRTPADLLLLGVTSAELIVLYSATPAFEVADWIYLSQHVVVLAIGLPLSFALIRTMGATAAAASYVILMLGARLATNMLCWRLLRSSDR